MPAASPGGPAAQAKNLTPAGRGFRADCFWVFISELFRVKGLGAEVLGFGVL